MKIQLSIALSIVICLSLFSSSYAQKQGGDNLYTLDSKVDGIDFKKWPMLYWQAYLDQNDNKTTDVNDKCYSIKHGSAVFLVNPFRISNANYECTFTTSNSFFFPLFSEECDYADITNDDALRECVTANNQFAKGKVFIDGIEMTDLSKYHFTTDFFNTNLTSNNPFGSTPGTYRALMDGLFVFVKPLPSGNHEIKYSMVQIKPSHDNDYASEITYKLNILDK